VILANSPFHRFKKGSLVIVTATACSVFGFFQSDPSTVGKHPKGFRKRNRFLFHHKAEYVTSDIAHPAFPNLSVWIDLKTRPSIVMEWTNANKVSALASQFGITAHQIDNAGRKANPILDFIVNREGHGYLILLMGLRLPGQDDFPGQ
jgi:hypothetical protein